MTMLPDLFSEIPVTTATLPIELDGIIARGLLWQAAEEQFLLNVPGVARYLVQTGSSIAIDAVANVPVRTVEYFLGMLPLAALLYQRGMLAFHAAALSNGESALLLAGDSGVGKSTLLAMLLQRGWRMLADDLAIVGLDKQGQPIVYPAKPGIALWSGSLEQLDIESDYLPLCDANRHEYSLPDQFETQPLPLRGIYHLSVHSKLDVWLKDIAASKRFHETGKMLYNSHVADALCSRADYLRCVAAIAGSVTYYELQRPRGVWSVDALADKIVI